jgi:hypothetical protein
MFDASSYAQCLDATSYRSGDFEKEFHFLEINFESNTTGTFRFLLNSGKHHRIERLFFHLMVVDDDSGDTSEVDCFISYVLHPILDRKDWRYTSFCSIPIWWRRNRFQVGSTSSLVASQSMALDFF